MVEPRASTPRHVVFVLTDDQGYPPIAAHGHPYVVTPHLDAFHSESVRLEDCHSGTTCAPTRAGLLTGHYCNSTGVWHTVGGRSLLRADEHTLADAFSAAGWRTGLFGKWHLGDVPPYRPQERGFQRTVVHGGGGVGQTPDWWGNDYFDDVYVTDGTPRRHIGYCTDVFFDLALDFIEADPASPSFTMISTNAPHSPFNAPPEYAAMYADAAKSSAYRRFLAMITSIDDNFGRLRRRLAAAGLEHDALVVFASDNGQCPLAALPEGDAFNAGMRGLKGSMYEGGHRIPFALRWPAGGVDGGRAVTPPTAYIDFMPTVLDICGIAAPRGHAFHGRSLRRLLEGEAPGPEWTERILVTDTQRVPNPVKWRFSCVMRADWRLINGERLYRLSQDPHQDVDIAADWPQIVSELRSAYEDWWNLCARQADQPIPIDLEDPSGAAVRLTSHDLRNDAGDGVWHQGQVRIGEACSGVWEVRTPAGGDFEFALWRWPPEAGRALSDRMEFEEPEIRRDAIAEADWWWYEGGAALSIVGGELVVDETRIARVPASPDAHLILFQANLSPGVHTLRAWLLGPNGEAQSPYYVTVRRIGPAGD